MTVFILSSLGLTFCFVIPLMDQPLSLGFCIMVLTLVMCMLVGVFLSSWYGFNLFSIYLGGLLVMFANVKSLNILNTVFMMNCKNKVCWVGFSWVCYYLIGLSIILLINMVVVQICYCKYSVMWPLWNV